jgi:rhomboid protease GluP
MLIALNVAVYAYTSIIGGNFIETNPNVIEYYGQVNELVMNGWYWQLFTAMFIHFDIVHIFGNMFFLLIFGLRAEEIFSKKEYLLIYFSSGFAGNLLTLLFGPNMVSAGASGAIFGVFGACVIYFRRSIGQSILGALLYAFFLFTISTGPDVNYLAHFGGLAVGLIIGFALATRRRRHPATYQYRYKYSV